MLYMGVRLANLCALNAPHRRAIGAFTRVFARCIARQSECFILFVAKATNSEFQMKTYLINHLRIPGDIPNETALSYLEQVEATVAPHGGKFLAMGAGDVTEGAWPGSVVL